MTNKLGSANPDRIPNTTKGKIKDKINQVLDSYTKNIKSKISKIKITKDMSIAIYKIIDDKKNKYLSMNDKFRLIDEFIALQELEDEKMMHEEISQMESRINDK